MDDLSQEHSPLLEREGKCKNDTVPSDKVEDSLQSVNLEQVSENVNSSFKAQDISNVKVPKLS